MNEVLMLLVGLGVPALVILAPFFLRAMERQQFWRSIMTANERGNPIPTELAEAFLLGSKRNDPVSVAQRDIRRGVVLVAIAIGLSLIGLCIYIGGNGEGDSVAIAMAGTALAAIPGCIGIAFIVLGRIANRAAPHSVDPV